MTNKRILILANEIETSKYIERLLTDYGYTSVILSKYEDLFQQNITSLKCDSAIIDLDINSPNNAIQLAQQIKDLSRIPILFIFTKITPKILEQIKIIDSYALLSKPVNGEELFAAIELALHKHSQYSKVVDHEERYRMVSSITSDIRFSLSVVSNDNLILDWITPTFETHLGYSLNKITKKLSVLEFAVKNIHADSLVNLKQELVRLKNGSEINSEIAFYKSDGEERWFNLHLIPKMNSKNQMVKIFGAAQDITDQKKSMILISELNNELEMRVQERTAQLETAVQSLHNEIAKRVDSENKLKESEEQFRSALSAVNAAVWDWRPLENFIYWSPSYYKMLGYQEDVSALSIERWKELIHPQDLKNGLNHLQKCIKNETDDFEYQCRFKSIDNDWKWILIRGRVLNRNDKNEISRMLGVYSDITQQKKAEEELSRQTFLIRQLLATVPDIIYFKDLESRFLVLSNSFLKRFGLESDKELKGKTDFDLFTNEHASQAFNDEQLIIATGIPIVSKEEKEIWLNNEEHWVLTTKMPLHDAHGKIIGTFGISRDITEKKKIELELVQVIKEWQTTFDSVSAVAWILNKDFEIIRSNYSVIAILDMNPEEVIGRKSWELVNTDLDRSGDSIETKLNNSRQRESTVIKRGTKYLSITLDPILDDDNNLIGAVETIADITQAYTAEEKVRNSELRLRTVVSNSPGIISSLDANGIITLSEGKSLHKINPVPGEAVGKSIYDLYKDYPEILDSIKSAYSGEIVKGLYTIGGCYFDTSIIPTFDADGKVEMITIMANDITEMKKAELTIIQDEARLKEAQSIANIGHYVYDIKSAQWSTSEQMEIIFGLNESYFKNNGNWLTLIHPDNRDFIIKYFNNANSIEQPQFDLEFKILRHSDGQIRWVHGKGDITYDDEGKPNQIFGTVQDITERKEATIQLNRSQFSIDKANDAVYWIAEDGHFEYVNDAASLQLGYTREELLNMSVFDIDFNITKGNWKDVYERLKQKKSFNKEMKHTAKDGRIIPVEVSSKYINFDGKELVVAFARDIHDRKETETHLLRTQFSMDKANEAIYWVNAEGNFEYANEAACKLYGCTKEEFLKLKTTDLDPRATKEVWKEWFNYLKENKSVQQETEQLRSDGKLYPIDITANYIGFENKEILACFVRDITGRKAAESALKESEERNRLLVENSPYAIVVHQNGKVVYANKRLLELQKAKSASEIIGKNVLDFVHPDSRELALNRIKEGGQTYNAQPAVEEKILQNDGTVIDCEVISVPIKLNGSLAYQVLLRDITEIKHVNEQLRKLSRAVEQSPAAILITNEDGVIEYVNPKFTEITGYTSGETIGKTPRLLKSGEQSAEIYQYLWNSIKSGNEWKGEFHNKKKNGELYWEYDIITPIKNSRGEIKNFIAIKEDITERKKLIQDIVKSKEEAEEANKVKSSLLANMSHEFRTPLNGILGFAQLLKDELKEENQVMMLSKIHSSGKRLMNTLNAVLTLTELESEDQLIQHTEIDLAFFCQEMRILFETAAFSKNLKISAVSEIEYLPVITDENLLTKIVSNIIDNAIKYTLTGEIKIKLETGLTSENNNAALIKIIDTGIGIRKEDQTTIFKEFRQLSEGFRRDFEGLGLGLTIANRMAKLLNVDILVDSVFGEGSTFTIVIPMEKLETKEESAVQTPAYEPPKAKKVEPDKLKILLVEDNPLNVEVVQRFLSKSGKVFSARDGMAAIRLATENDFDLLLIDINLGHGIDGSEVLRQLHKLDKYKHTPSIALTGYASETNKREFLGQGFTSYLAKPFEKKTLLKLIEELV